MKRYEKIIEILVILLFFSGIVGLTIYSSKAELKPGTISDSTIAMVIPEATNYAVDTTGTISPDTLSKLNMSLKDFNGTAQIAILVVNSTWPYTIEDYGIMVADKWKVGYSGKDNGAIIILAIEDRKVRIEVGKGLEGTLNDAKVGRILDDYMVPSLKENNWDQALLNGVVALKTELSK